MNIGNLIRGGYKLPLLLALTLVPTIVKVILLAYDHPIGYTGIGSYYYFVGYETGFGGRKLLGTLFHYLLPAYSTWSHLRPYIIGINLALVALFILFVARVWRSGNNKGMLVLLSLYMVSPYSPIGFVYSWMSTTSLETWQWVLLLGWLLLFLSAPRKWWYYILTLLIATAGILIHHTFCCTFLPVMLGLFFYESFSGGQFQKRAAIAYGTICFLLLGLFIALWSFSTMNLPQEELRALIRGRASSDACIDSEMLMKFYYYLSSSDNFQQYWISKPGFYRTKMIELGLSMILLAPLFITLLWPWFSAARRENEKARRRLYYAMGLLPTLLTLPLFFVVADYGRDWTALSFTLLAVPLAVVARGDKALGASLMRMWDWICRHPIVCLALMVYLLQLHPSGPHNGYGPGAGLYEALELIKRFLR